MLFESRLLNSEAEVSDFAVTFLQENVLRLEVSVDYLFVFEGVESFGDLETEIGDKGLG